LFYSAQVHTLFRPEPAKRSRRQQAVDHAIQHVFQSYTPGYASPDRVLQLRQRVSNKGCQACDVEYLHIFRTRRARATGETSRKKTNYYAIEKPLAQELSHVRCSTWHDHEQADGSSLHFL